MASSTDNVRYTPWRRNQHPTLDLMSHLLHEDGFRPYKMKLQGNYRNGAQSHGFSKVLYCVEGKVEVTLPDSRNRVTLNPGDRLDLAPGTRHSLTVGTNGAMLLEGTPNLRR
jgi:quercetin dioxygenase-like cupin family protein